MSMTDSVRVTIVSASAVTRQLIARTLAATGDVEVVATASAPVFAREKMRAQWPDVLVVDCQAPYLENVAFIREVMAKRPTPVVVCAPLADAGAAAGDEALAAGAVARIDRPERGHFAGNGADDLVQAVRRAAKASVRAAARPVVAPRLSVDAVLEAGSAAAVPPRGGEQLVAIGTSTGGTQALEVVLTQLPASSLGIVIVQHMPAVFTAMFAERLHSVSQIDVREAQDGDRVRPGLALVAPGGRHMLLRRRGTDYLIEVVDGPPVNRHKPSVDVLFRSVARFAGGNALGIIMTGMGDDGARGLKEMHDAGATTIAQDEASCVVFGMPNEAIKLGAVDLTLPLGDIPGAIINYSRGSQ